MTLDRIHVCDLFEDSSNGLMASMIKKWFDVADGDTGERFNWLALFKKETAEYTDMIKIHPGNITKRITEQDIAHLCGNTAEECCHIGNVDMLYRAIGHCGPRYAKALLSCALAFFYSQAGKTATERYVFHRAVNECGISQSMMMRTEIEHLATHYFGLALSDFDKNTNAHVSRANGMGRVPWTFSYLMFFWASDYLGIQNHCFGSKRDATYTKSSKFISDLQIVSA